MKNNIPETPEEFFEQVQKTQHDLFELRKKAWQKNEKIIKESLNRPDFEFSDKTKDAYIELLKGAWTRGYDDGITDMAKYFASEMEGNDTIDILEAFKIMNEQQKNSNPLNN